MHKIIEINVNPEKILDFDFIKKLALKELKRTYNFNANDFSISLIKRSLDARGKYPIYKLKILAADDNQANISIYKLDYSKLKENSPVCAIIGFGPAGMFAALRLIELGIKPVIFERGSDVRNRRKDLRNIMLEGIVNPDSNYCFGEGGAGTYSDGKLYTRSTKKGDVLKILNIFVKFGASKDILIDAHPHIGSNKLPKIVQNIREQIVNCGGEVRFNSKATDLLIKENKIIGLIINDKEEFLIDNIILSIGHSARDIFYLLHKKGIKIYPKPFAIGVRIEHPQYIIDEMQYKCSKRPEYLPPATYWLTNQTKDNRGVYSFCMCPGGLIIPSSTKDDELVLNGMSTSRRNSPFANSGIVAQVNEKELDLYNIYYPFNGVVLQEEIERKAFGLGGGKQMAPAQRAIDFVDGKVSASLPKSSYVPGINSVDLSEIFPSFITDSLKESLKVFGKKKKSFLSQEALLLAPETRTSSPIKIPRNDNTFENDQIKGLYPCGEGAGYAGGIVSAALDGEACATKVAEKIFNTKLSL